MIGIYMTSNNDPQQHIKDAILHKYTTLMEDALRRTGTQSNVIGWLIGLTGTFIGLLIAFSPPGMNHPLLFAFSKPSPEALKNLAFLIVGYVVVAELLISYWVYQLFHMLTIVHDVDSLEGKYKKYLKIDREIDLWSWKTEFENVITSSCNNVEKWSLKMVKYSQPFALYIMTGLGIVSLTILMVMGLI